MRRLLQLSVAVVLVCAVAACSHTHGVCDCEPHGCGTVPGFVHGGCGYLGNGYLGGNGTIIAPGTRVEASKEMPKPDAAKELAKPDAAKDMPKSDAAKDLLKKDDQ